MKELVSAKTSRLVWRFAHLLILLMTQYIFKNLNTLEVKMTKSTMQIVSEMWDAI